jgi:hypothetical protein
VQKLAIDASTAAKWQLSDEPEAEPARRRLYKAVNNRLSFVRWIGDYPAS